MAQSPGLKVYNPKGEYVAACKHAEDAAAIVALYGDGATIRYSHRNIVWREGVDGKAGESFDALANTVYERVDAILAEGVRIAR